MALRVGLVIAWRDGVLTRHAKRQVLLFDAEEEERVTSLSKHFGLVEADGLEWLSDRELF